MHKILIKNLNILVIYNKEIGKSPERDVIFSTIYAVLGNGNCMIVPHQNFVAVVLQIAS